MVEINVRQQAAANRSDGEMGFYQPRIAILSSVRKADCSVGVYPPNASSSRVVDHLAGQATDESSGLQAKPEIYPTASPTLRPTYREMLPRIPNQ